MEVKIAPVIETVVIEIGKKTVRLKVSMTDSDIMRISEGLTVQIGRIQQIAKKIDNGASLQTDLARLFAASIKLFVGEKGYAKILRAIGAPAENCNFAMKEIFAAFLELMYRHVVKSKINELSDNMEEVFEVVDPLADRT